MNISDKINTALDEVLNQAINENNVSKILTLLTDEILKLETKTISIREQCEIINKAFNLDIKESAYRSFYYRKIKKLLNRKTTVKKVDYFTTQDEKKEVKKVAPLESKKSEKKEGATLDNFDTYQRPKKTSKYDKFL